ncbi:MAG: PqqD family protein [Chloroflexota bacterium]
MQEEKRPGVNPDLSWRLLDGEAVIVSPVTGKIRVLNAVGTEIWQLLASGASIETIEAALVEHHRISMHKAQEDVTAFLQELTERKLIIWQTTRLES